MIKLLVSALSSGSGKTAVSCALLAALQKIGLNPCAFKCGPDYIDPMFHRAVLGVESHNLDLFLAGETGVRKLFCRRSRGHGAAVCEGVMGYYDGLGGVTSQCSSYDTARALGLGTLLVLRPGGSSLTLAAQVKGLCAFRRDHRIRGLFLNHCSPMLYASLGPVLERETGLPVLGYLPPMKAAEMKSRHLGLYTAAEIEDLSARVEALAAQLERTADLDRLMAVFSCPAEEMSAFPREKKRDRTLRLAVAKDRAFCFCYEESLDAFRREGIEPVFFSPLEEKALPEGTTGLYLPGGYPELYAKELAANGQMRHAVRKAAAEGMPIVAECGGYLYLCEKLEDVHGNCFPMAGVLSGTGRNQNHLVRFGYAYLTAAEDSLLFRQGERVPVHEFHYWDTEEMGTAFSMEKPVSGRNWRCGYGTKSLYAAFPHLYFGGENKMAERLAEAMAQWKEEQRYGNTGSMGDGADQEDHAALGRGQSGGKSQMDGLRPSAGQSGTAGNHHGGCGGTDRFGKAGH